jgi:hypothetical protein
MTSSHSSMASYVSNHSSAVLNRTPRASFPSEPSSIDSALGPDCQPSDVCPPPLARRESQPTFQTFLTYASTITADLGDEDDEDEILPPNRPAMFLPDNLVAASPKDFAELFPSARKLLIKHDDTTIDGNMNLRIDTSVKTTSGQLKDMTLFHLRMHDLKRREFSIRRYCRDSGREVCHSSRKPEQPPAKKVKSSGAFSSVHDHHAQTRLAFHDKTRATLPSTATAMTSARKGLSHLLTTQTFRFPTTLVSNSQTTLVSASISTVHETTDATTSNTTASAMHGSASSNQHQRPAV